MNGSLEGIGSTSEKKNIHSFFEANLQREIERHNKVQPKDLSVSGDLFVYPGVPVEKNIETIVTYAQETLDYWSAENERGRIESGKANFSIDRSKFQAFRVSVQATFGNRAFELYKVLNDDRVGVIQHGSHTLDIPYLVAVAERFMELRGDQGK